MDQPIEAYLDVQATESTEPTEPTDEIEITEEIKAVVADPAADEPSARPPAKKKGRASVPTWDEIMFGPSDGESGPLARSAAPRPSSRGRDGRVETTQLKARSEGSARERSSKPRDRAREVATGGSRPPS